MVSNFGGDAAPEIFVQESIPEGFTMNHIEQLKALAAQPLPFLIGCVVKESDRLELVMSIQMFSLEIYHHQSACHEKTQIRAGLSSVLPSFLFESFEARPALRHLAWLACRLCGTTSAERSSWCPEARCGRNGTISDFFCYYYLAFAI